MDLELIKTVPDKITAEIIKGFLEKHDIKVLIQPNPGVHGAFLGTFGCTPPLNPWLVYVPKDKAEKVKKAIKAILIKKNKINKKII